MAWWEVTKDSRDDTLLSGNLKLDQGDEEDEIEIDAPPQVSFSQVSTLEKLLQTPSCTVEALLDEEDVIQEFKTGHPKLVARLPEPDAMKVLIECTACEAPAEATQARC